MPETLHPIRLPLINSYMRTVRSLASRGRNEYTSYLVRPLSVWSQQVPDDALEALLAQIDIARTQRSAAQAGTLYKKAIVRAVAPDQLDLAVPGKLALDFLGSMSELPDLAARPESLQFMELLRKPFADYNKREFNRINGRFAKEVETANEDEMRDYLARREQRLADEDARHRESLAQIARIEHNFQTKNLLQLRRECIGYLLRMSDRHLPLLHRDIDPFLEKASVVYPGLNRDVYDTTAVLIYHEIIKAVRGNDLRRALDFIAKYAILFQGHASTPHFYEVDSFEKQLYEIIRKRDLWESLEQ